MTRPYLASCSRVMAPSSSGEEPRNAKPRSSGLRRTSTSPSALTISAFRRATIGFGVPAGARIANQELKVKPGKPDSEMVGTSGNCGKLRRAHADQPELPSTHQRRHGAQALKTDRDLTRSNVGGR